MTLRLGVILGCLAIAATAQTHRSLVVGGSAASINFGSWDPDIYPRGEFAIHDFGTGDKTIFDASNWLSCKIVSGNVRCNSGSDGAPQGIAQVPIGSMTHVRGRWNRDAATGNVTVQLWNYDCTGYAMSAKPGKGNAPQTAAQITLGPNISIAFLRFYTTVDTSETCPADIPAQNASGPDFRFEGDNPDSVSTAHSVSGGAFGNSPPYPPAAVIASATRKPVARAGVALTLDGSGSLTFVGSGQPSTYLWQVVSGPATPHFVSGRTTAQPQIVFPVAGQYTLRLRATDSTGTAGTVDQAIGVVATDSRNVVRPPVSKALQIALGPGPVLRHFASPWPWYDNTADRVMDILRPYQTAAVAETAPISGTWTITSAAPNSIQGGMVCCQPRVVGTGGSATAQLAAGETILVHWDALGDGSYAGRYYTSVQSVTSDNAINIGTYYWPIPVAKSSGMRISKSNVDFARWHGGAEPSNSWHYYEAALIPARLWLASGLEAYRDQFRAMCPIMRKYVFDHGYSTANARNAGAQTMIACAADGRPELWPEIDTYLSRQQPNPTAPVTSAWVDWRPQAFKVAATALYARLGTSGVSRTTWCGYLKNQFTNLWKYKQQPDGSWPDNLFALNPSFPAKDINGIYGNAPWRTMGLGIVSLHYAYEAFADTSAETGCNDPTFAANEVLPVITAATQYLWDYGRDSNRGLFYNVMYETAQDGTKAGSSNYTYTASVSGTTVTRATGSEDFTVLFAPCNGTVSVVFDVNTAITAPIASCTSTTLTLASAYTGPAGTHKYGRTPVAGVASVVNGSATITRAMGNASDWTSMFAPCDGTTYIGIYATDDAFKKVYQVAPGSCTASSVQITVPYPGATESSVYASKAVRAQTNCGPNSIATYCEPDPYNGRALLGDGPAAMAWMATRTGLQVWIDRAKEFAGADFGGPPGGAGTLGACVGPLCDGAVGSMGGAITDGVDNSNTGMGKTIGQRMGKGNSPNAMADIAGGAAPAITRTLRIPFVLPSGATQARITITAPDGTSAQTTCATSPCAVSADAELGAHRYQIEYLTAGGAVAARGEPQILRVQ